MGSIFEWISMERAADALGVSKRQVYKYIAKGQLTTHKDGGHTLVNRHDVRALIEARKKGVGKAVNPMTVARLDAEVQLLRKQVDTLMRLQDIRYEPLDLTAEDLSNLHQMAAHRIQNPWSPYEEKMWCDVFVRIRLEDLEKIAEHTGEEDPWRPFYALAKAMFNHPQDQENKLILSAGKNNLERIGFIWSDKLGMKDARDIDRMVKKDDVAVRRMDRKLERIQQKLAPKKE